MISKLTDIIDDRTSSKSKISTKVRKNVSKKPDLRKIVKSSGKKVEALRRSVKSKDKQVESAKIRIKKIHADKRSIFHLFCGCITDIQRLQKLLLQVSTDIRHKTNTDSSFNQPYHSKFCKVMVAIHSF